MISLHIQLPMHVRVCCFFCRTRHHLSRLLFLRAHLCVCPPHTRVAASPLCVQEIAFFDKEDTAELVTRLSADTAQLQAALTASLVGAARNTTMAVGATAMLVGCY